MEGSNVGHIFVTMRGPIGACLLPHNNWMRIRGCGRGSRTPICVRCIANSPDEPDAGRVDKSRMKEVLRPGEMRV